jgi:hypothetical protein
MDFDSRMNTPTVRVKSSMVKTPNFRKFRPRVKFSTAKSPFRTKNGLRNLTLRVRSNTMKKRKN